MRFISSISALALFALSGKFPLFFMTFFLYAYINFVHVANAANMKKSGISSQVQVCRDHIDAIDAQIPTVHNLVSCLQKNLFN